MRVAHVIVSIDPAYGGPVTVVMGMVAALAARGHDVRLITLDAGDRQPAVADLLRKTPGVARVDFRFISSVAVVRQMLTGKLKAALRPLLADRDVVHVHGVWYALAKASADVSRELGKPYAFSPHGMLDPSCLRRRGLKKRIALAMGFRRVLTGAAFYHATSSIESTSFPAIGLKTPVCVLPPGLSDHELNQHMDPGRFHRLCPRIANRPYILFLGRLHPIKGLDYLADAFARLAADEPHLQWVVAGPDDGEQSPLTARLERLGVLDRVHFVGPLWDADKFAAMAGAMAFTLTSRHENFGMVVAEAMWAGVPVIVSDQVHLHEDVTRAAAGLVVPLDSSAIARAITQLRDDSALRRRMGLAGHDWVDQNLRWPGIIQRLEECYARVIPAVRPRST